MKSSKIISLLLLATALLAVVASAGGIFIEQGNGPYNYTTIRGEQITISGRGLYHHMSADVAIQGVAQDYITLFLGVPVLLILIVLTMKWDNLSLHILQTGLTGYFMVTYFFYLAMGMYNQFFLIYVMLITCSFFAFYLQMQQLMKGGYAGWYGDKRPAFAGWFLIANAVMVGLMWLGVIVPPLLDGSLYPAGLDHYTTMIVQGYDLAILLPASFVAGLLFVRRRPAGFLWAPVYLVFLTFMMAALTAKIVGMGMTGVDTRPAIYIIPLTAVLSATGAYISLKGLKIKAGELTRP
jgi:hypothetical protein